MKRNVTAAFASEAIRVELTYLFEQDTRYQYRVNVFVVSGQGGDMDQLWTGTVGASAHMTRTRCAQDGKVLHDVASAALSFMVDELDNIDDLLDNAELSADEVGEFVLTRDWMV